MFNELLDKLDFMMKMKLNINLFGMNGTGKTHLIKTLLQEANSTNYIYLNFSCFINTRELYKILSHSAKSIMKNIESEFNLEKLSINKQSEFFDFISDTKDLMDLYFVIDDISNIDLIFRYKRNFRKFLETCIENKVGLVLVSNFNVKTSELSGIMNLDSITPLYLTNNTNEMSYDFLEKYINIIKNDEKLVNSIKSKINLDFNKEKEINEDSCRTVSNSTSISINKEKNEITNNTENKNKIKKFYLDDPNFYISILNTIYDPNYSENKEMLNYYFNVFIKQYTSFFHNLNEVIYNFGLVLSHFIPTTNYGMMYSEHQQANLDLKYEEHMRTKDTLMISKDPTLSFIIKTNQEQKFKLEKDSFKKKMNHVLMFQIINSHLHLRSHNEFYKDVNYVMKNSNNLLLSKTNSRLLKIQNSIKITKKGQTNT